MTCRIVLLDDATANLDAVAAVPDADVTFDNVIAPLMAPPNFKTNPLICQSKFLQHCSTDAALREAAEEAGKKFAAFKADARRRSDVYAKVTAYAATAEAKALPYYQAHFVQVRRPTPSPPPRLSRCTDGARPHTPPYASIRLHTPPYAPIYPTLPLTAIHRPTAPTGHRR